MRDRAKDDKIKLPHKILPKGSSIPHEHYNTRNELSSSPFKVRRKIWHETSQPKIQQIDPIPQSTTARLNEAAAKTITSFIPTIAFL